MRNVLLLVVVAGAVVAGDASADRGTIPTALARGLAPAPEHARARGVVVLRPPREGRVRVVGGTFRMGSTPVEMARAVALCRREVLGNHCDDPGIANGFRAEGRDHEVTLMSFDLDRTEVTVRAYERCVEAGACAPPGYPPGDARFDRPDLPVTHVRWDDATAYCAWALGRLPTEAEWELAARGTERREYPWGNVFNPHLANHGALAQDETDATDGFVNLAPVGSFPDGATPLGILDLAGNAAEWVMDLYDLDDNNFGYGGAPQVSPKGPQSGSTHVIRGGSFAEGAAWMRGAARSTIIYARHPSVGFRCAYEP
jgi:formylglycine-generating enzyme required for sulfatase activity